MAYTPYVTDGNAWTRHFVAMAEGKTKKYGQAYRLKAPKENAGGGGKDPIKIVTETARSVEQAKKVLQREEEEYEENLSASNKSSRQPPSKRKKSVLKRTSHRDIFTD
jgi:hypothetical protein